MAYLISETTKEEREQMVKDSLGNIEANCDGCMSGLADMYQDFLSLKGEERKRCLEIAKTVLFSETNVQLKSHRIPGMKPGSIWQLLYALCDCGLKNDALLLDLYEYTDIWN